MPKLTVYLRVGDKGPDTSSPHRFRTVATAEPSQEPVMGGSYILPTCAFALELDIPDEAFHSAARIVAKLEVPEERLRIAAKVIAEPELEEEEPGK